ncbi:hypothetical protein D3C81_2039680 [compost metagenome]
MCVNRAGRVKLATVDAIAITVALETGDAVMSGFGPEFGERITEALAGQHLGV